MIDENKLLEQIADFKRCQKSANCDYLTGYISALSAVEGMIAEQPKVGEWIPCSERLPEEDVDVLLCVNDEYDNAYFTVAYHHIIWQTEVGGMYGEVVAWMPLPEPYKEDA